MAYLHTSHKRCVDLGPISCIATFQFRHTLHMRQSSILDDNFVLYRRRSSTCHQRRVTIDEVFQVFGAQVWYGLPPDVIAWPSRPIFRRRLRTSLSIRSFESYVWLSDTVVFRPYRMHCIRCGLLLQNL